MKIRIGTRGSKLALWQAHHVADLLKAGGVEAEIVTIETVGDKILDVSIAKIGSKGVFTEEIEDQLLTGHIDIAVHSAKDLQSQLPEPFEIIAFTNREIVNDVLVSHKAIEFGNRELVIGTSSTRRVALFKRHYPLINTVAVRGNLQTRIQKMKDGACDALMLAYAGVHRMGYEEMIIHRFPVDEFIPAVGQGSVAIECCSGLESDKKAVIKKLINHHDTETRLRCERAYLRKLHGGCSIPVFGLATIKGQEILIKGGIVSLDGKELIQFEKSGAIAHAEAVGTALATDVMEAGGSRILHDIRRQLET